MAIVDDAAPPQKKGPSMVLQLAALLGLTVVAIGIGWGSGLYLSGSFTPAAPAETAAESPATGGHGEGQDAPAGPQVTYLKDAQDQLGIVYLEPITTNLAGPTGIWVRLELALIFDGGNDVVMAQTIQQDFLAYLRTVKIHQVDGASGFQHLKSDLEERASLRSNGKVKGVLIRTILFE